MGGMDGEALSLIELDGCCIALPHPEPQVIQVLVLGNLDRFGHEHFTDMAVFISVQDIDALYFQRTGITAFALSGIEVHFHVRDRREFVFCEEEERAVVGKFLFDAGKREVVPYVALHILGSVVGGKGFAEGGLAKLPDDSAVLSGACPDGDFPVHSHMATFYALLILPTTAVYDVHVHRGASLLSRPTQYNDHRQPFLGMDIWNHSCVDSILG